MILYLDTSALAKRYLVEPGSSWIRIITDLASGNTIAIANITRVEIGAAIARRQRDPRYRMSLADREALIRLFDHRVVHEYVVLDIALPIIDDAYRLTQHHQLRGYDAIQLAAAGLPTIALISSDGEMLEAAGAEGLATDDPVLYP